MRYRVDRIRQRVPKLQVSFNWSAELRSDFYEQDTYHFGALEPSGSSEKRLPHPPAFEALARGKSFVAALKPQIIPGVIAGLIAAAVIVLSWALLRPFLPGGFVARAEAFNRLAPLPTRILYGGITERNTS